MEASTERLKLQPPSGLAGRRCIAVGTATAAAETADRAAKFREYGDAGAYVTDVEAKGVGCGLARKVAVGREDWIYEARSHRRGSAPSPRTDSEAGWSGSGPVEVVGWHVRAPTGVARTAGAGLASSATVALGGKGLRRSVPWTTALLSAAGMLLASAAHGAPGDRATALAQYEATLADRSVPAGWTGSAQGCVVGEESQASLDATLNTLNTIRSFAGISTVGLRPGPEPDGPGRRPDDAGVGGGGARAGPSCAVRLAGGHQRSSRTRICPAGPAPRR